MVNTFAGHLTTFDKKTSDEIVDEDILIEVVDLKNTGEVEIQFRDRNEDCYLRIPLAELVAGAARLVGTKESA